MDLKSLFGGIVTPQNLQAQQMAEEQQALQLYAQDQANPWRFTLERSLNNINKALPNSAYQQQLRAAQQNEEVLKRSTAKYGELVKGGTDPSKAQLAVLDSAMQEFTETGNYDAISALAPTYMALQSKMLEQSKLQQQERTAAAQEEKARVETAIAPVLAQEKLDTGASTRSTQAVQRKVAERKLAETTGLQILDLTNAEAGPVVAAIDPVTQTATITGTDGITKTLKPGQYREVPTKGAGGGGSPKPMPNTVAKDLQAAGRNLDSSEELITLFQPGYGGYKRAEAGDLDMALKRNVFGDNKGAAEWWAKYQAKSQEIRHGLYGASFTATEREEWNKQAINPGMLPDTIKARLEAQRAIEEKVASRLSKGWSQTYGSEQVDAFMGRSFSDKPADKPAGAGAGSFDYVPGKGLVPRK